ncbi:MAG: DUF499 domain-containing protein, partial [Chloroflexia bacterium]|nr:DUF499 domain-containing protein [Chloroflexia bacterium]
YASSQKHVVVVLTLADSFDAFGRETDELKQELSEARRVSARQERVITPTGEPEIAAIVTHRLFRSVDQAAAQAIAHAYQGTFVRLIDQGTDLPQDASRAEYARGIVQCYPFHPELLNALNRKVSTIPNFQKTRGALRLLAAVVRQLWDQRPAGTLLIHPFHIDLSVAQISEDLTSRLVRPAFQQVIEADIVSPLLGSPSHAQSIDSNWVASGKPPYASRVATTILLHSLTQGTASGLPLADLMLATVQPQDDPTLIAKAIERLVDSCWFLDYDGRNFRFKTEPALNKIVADEMALVGKMKAKSELDGRIRQIWKKGVLQPVYFPVEAADVDDDAGPPKLVIIHYDAAAVTVATSAPPDLVRKLAERTGSLEGYRTYRNNVLFLVADQGQLERMVEVAQRHLAFARIVGDAGRMGEFNREQRDKLKDMQKTSELEVRVAITRTYSHFYYPSADAPQKHASLSHEVLPPQDQGDIDHDQSQVVLRMLRQLDKVITADTPDMAPTYVRAKAWDSGQPSMSVEDLRRAFAKRMSLRILLDINQLKKTIRSGIQHNVWVYYDTIEQLGYNATVPPPSPQISDDVLLYLPDEARRQGLKLKGDQAAEPEATCPVCHHPISQCACDDGEIGSEGGSGGSIGGNRGGGPARKVIYLHAEGAPAQAFQAIVDQCGDQGVRALTRLVIMIEGTGKAGASDVRALGLIIPQMGKGQFQLEQSLGAEFGPGEQLSVSFKGGWDRYKRLKAVTEAFSGEASKLNVRTTLRADFAEPLEANGSQFQTIRDVFGSMDMGRL